MTSHYWKGWFRKRTSGYVHLQEREVTAPEGKRLTAGTGDSRVLETAVWVLGLGVTVGCVTRGWDDGRRGFSSRIMSPTSFVYGESVDASNFIQLDDLECHFQPLNITLQVPPLQTVSVMGDQREGPCSVSSQKQLKGQAPSWRNCPQLGWLKCGVGVRVCSL